MLAKANDMLGLPVNDLLTIHEDLNKFNRVFRGLTALANVGISVIFAFQLRGDCCVCVTHHFLSIKLLLSREVSLFQIYG